MPPTAAPTRDIGTPDLDWGEWGQGLLADWWETSADLIWPNSIVTFSRMRHDPQLKAVLNAYLLPILRATWAVDPAGCRDEVVQHVADDLGLMVLDSGDEPGPARRRGISWARHLRSAAFNHLVFGHMPFERRYRIESERPGGCRLDHLGERMPWTVADINLNRDATIRNIVQTTQQEPIPANRLVWYVTGHEGANWAGQSLLRPAYGAWLLKHETWRVHATSIRRFGMGVPYVEAPAGATAGMVAEARAMAAAMRAGDQSGAGLPAGYVPHLMGLTGSVPDALAFIRYLDQAMAKMALAGLIELGQTETGSRALGETFLDLFLLSLQAVADDLADTATSGQDGIPGIVTDLVDQNWGEDEAAPRIVCTDVGESYKVTAEALKLLSDAGLVFDPALDAWIRKTWRLPEREEPEPPPGPPGGALPAPVPGGQPPGGPPAPAPAPTPAPGPGGPSASRARRRWPWRRRARAAGLRRKMTAREEASGFDAAAHQQEWQGALAALLAAYRPVVAAQRDALGDAVAAAVRAGDYRLGALTTPDEGGAVIIEAALGRAADAAAARMADEAAAQGVTIPLEKVTIPQAKLRRIAEARAAMAGRYLAQQASARALQVVRAASLMDQAQSAGDDITAFLEGLSEQPLAQQLGAALTAAQNTGRVSVLEAAPESAGQAVYVATEVLDQNTCDPCEAIDGTEFGSLDEAEEAYPNGGYADCDGMDRCRGTVIAVWGEGTTAHEPEDLLGPLGQHMGPAAWQALEGYATAPQAGGA